MTFVLDYSDVRPIVIQIVGDLRFVKLFVRWQNGRAVYNRGMENLQTLTREDIEYAYRCLSRSDQIIIDSLAVELRNVITRRRHKLAMFGRAQALELLAKVGVFLVRQKR